MNGGENAATARSVAGDCLKDQRLAQTPYNRAGNAVASPKGLFV